ncbi:MAG: hypothetical protein EAZ84_11885 [Verrucomicrobia bacterium]|nr:MAG: hypothetical protein EAZ84_11885 [Verrucomicrobiota bacterium]TAE86052.1 MAG: hypothetical protein EAZ82_12390 [Verrucomicrobiota bacterium]TAF25841.1 MAG: hypothetical protein EAZ71_06775 [Verrucomicrobiota bacterium]
MRRLPLILLSLPILLAATYLLWQHRFETDLEPRSIELADLAATTKTNAGVTWDPSPDGSLALQLELSPEHPRIVQRFELPALGRVDFLLADFQLEATDLVPGPQVWDDGRLMIEWHASDDQASMDPDYLGSARASTIGNRSTLVCHPNRGPAVPVLRVENLGNSGAFRVLHLRLSVVHESHWWRYGKWLLGCAWLAWAALLAGSWQTSGLGRPLLAAGIWLWIATQSVIPGPWQAIRPLATSFAGIVTPSGPAKTAAFKAPATEATEIATQAVPSVVQPLGKLPERGNLMLRIKSRIQQIRPLLHGLLFLVPTLAFALLVGRKAALALSSLLAIGIESAQLLFGYGLDFMDFLDLACDASGIVFAMVLVKIRPRGKVGRPGGPALPHQG